MISSRHNSAVIACILNGLPDCGRSEGVIVAIGYAYAFGFANHLWSKPVAVLTAVAASMERAEGHGKGSKAARRLSAIRAAQHGVTLDDWLALERDMDELDRDEARAETQRWFEALQRGEEVEAPI